MIDAHFKGQCHERKVTSGNKETTNWTLAALLRIVTFMPILIILSRGICILFYENLCLPIYHCAHVYGGWPFLNYIQLQCV